VNQKNFFLLSILPALAYWYLEANYSVKIAVTGGLLLAILELSLEWIFTKHIHFISKFNFFLIGFLGGLSLLGDEGIWFKLQPCFTGIIMGGLFLFKIWRGKGIMAEMMESLNSPNRPMLPEFVLKTLEIHSGIFLMVYGTFMGGVALKASTGQWLFYKTGGFYIAFLVFMAVEIYFMRKKLKNYRPLP